MKFHFTFSVRDDIILNSVLCRVELFLVLLSVIESDTSLKSEMYGLSVIDN